MYIPNFATAIPNFGMYVPKFGIEKSLRKKNITLRFQVSGQLTSCLFPFSFSSSFFNFQLSILHFQFSILNSPPINLAESIFFATFVGEIKDS